MELITKEIERKLPALYATENIALADKVAIVKYFTPWGNWSWYGIEYDPEQELFFGYVEGIDKEFGYFSLKELRSIRGRYRLGVERDLHFEPAKIGDIAEGRWFE